MSSLFSVFFCLLALGVASGQTPELQPDNRPAKNYLDYYHAIAFAEEAVVNGSYQDAVKQYQKIFEEYPYNNPIDCYIAAQVSSYAGDTTSCIKFMYKGLSFGLPVQTVVDNPHLEPCLKKTDQHIIDSCWSMYQQRIDHKARAAMISLIQRDQSIVRALPTDELYDYRRSGDPMIKDKYLPIWDSLVREVIAITRVSGFPAQKIIGTQNGEDSLFQTGPNAVFVAYIFIHHCNAWSQVGEMLWMELLKGNITPQMYGVIYEHSSGKGFYNNPIHYFASRSCQEKQCKKLVRENLREINNARWEIGLGSYEVMQKKFESQSLYRKWCQRKTKTNEPVFDFQCDLGFQGKY